MAVAYAQISRAEYIKLRRQQLQAIEFGKPIPSIAPDLIEKVYNVMNASDDENPISNSDITQVVDRRAKVQSALQTDLLKEKIDLNSVDFGNSIDDDLDESSFFYNVKNYLKKLFSFVIIISTTVGIAYFTYNYYQKNIAPVANTKLTSEMENAATSFFQASEFDARVEIMVGASKLLIENHELITTSLLSNYLTILEGATVLEKRELYAEPILLDVEFSLSQLRDKNSARLSTGKETYEKTKEIKSQNVVIETILEITLQIKLDAFNQ